MVHGNVWASKTRRLLRLNPDNGYFEEQGVSAAAAAASNHHGPSELQVPHGHVCRGSAYGWLFLTDENLDMKLLNPFSGAEIQLPPVPHTDQESKRLHRMSYWYVKKAVFSANPSIEPRPVVLIIYGGKILPRLAFCKPGDKRWTPLVVPAIDSFSMDAIYHKGQFYVLGWPGYVAAFDIGSRCIDDDDDDDDDEVKSTLISFLSVKKTLISTPPELRAFRKRDWYFVVLDSVYLTGGGGTFDDTDSFFETGIYNVKDKNLKPLVYPGVFKFQNPSPMWVDCKLC